ncbi:Murein DD-endopeptidase MepM [Microbacterium hydrocarbonoxydans]|uniref:Murein DD-endopeptidase MepM n=1 Tax=Microbacterium hydrocarbonoxydans TaxID=273678 RepID=A0A0M2HXJ3_9MICO|nr:M23 family metallopeptidase [Microbacterium hydrocarbonoxydans]KJL49149.1 Murein DD-endopeptidase MepM [Microbacterium hydrocarbonoxydans]
MPAVLWPNGSASIPPVTSEFNPARKNPVTGIVQPHTGIDLVGWSTILAPVDGVVTFAGYNGGAGNEVRIRADGANAFIKGDVFRMLHNRELWVRTGQRVTQGQGVAVMGTTGNSTGTHCHFETRPGGGSAINPRDYMASRNASTSGGTGTPSTPSIPQTGDPQMFLFYAGVLSASNAYLATYDGRTLKVRPTQGVEAKALIAALPSIPRVQLTSAEVVDLCAQGGYAYDRKAGVGRDESGRVYSL